ncbi:MAG: peptide chain release factor N(5)-glutamine methyltransferase [Clostridia bacterium]|nr:peptide chain release factor N(5)-glutamine methyltransferase [Clostridia bacterium]
MVIKELLEFGVNELNKAKIEDSVLKVRILLSYCLGESKEFLVSHDDLEVDSNVQKNFYDGIDKLKENVPIQYITHNQEFMKLNFYVDERVLIPRDDTEVLVQEVLDRCKDGFKVLDLCSGSGAIGISIKKYKPEVKVWCSDISLGALDVARKNSIDNCCEVEFVRSDLFENIEEKNFDIIVSNPPYISKVEMSGLDEEVKKEPEIALYGGVHGLDFYKKIISDAKGYLKNDGFLCLEIGYNQKNDVEELLSNNGFIDVVCVKDLYGNDRVVIGNTIQ